MRREEKHNLKRGLQIRFVLLAALAAMILLGSIMGIVLLRSYGQITKKADHLLEVIRTDPDSPEIGDSRYFTVFLSPTKHTAELSHTASMREMMAIQLGRQALKSEKQRGFLDGWRFSAAREADGMSILFLSRKLPLEAFRYTAKLLIAVSLLGFVLTVVILTLLSGRIVMPLVKASEQQKRFITSASHALKTPVAVILGDTQLLQMEISDNEWLCDIEKQAGRLTEMTQALVTLSRCDEGIQQNSFIDFPLSDLAEDVAASFQTIAASQSIDFRVHIEKSISCCGDEKALREMLTILLDNAFRYCPAGGSVSLILEKMRRTTAITVQNTADNIRREELPHFTERFYRGSTSGGTSGSGLGLAIAQAIVQRHRGRLTVTAPAEREIAICVTL